MHEDEGLVRLVENGVQTRRRIDRFLELQKQVHATRDIREGLSLVLHAFQEWGYEFPRIFRYDRNDGNFHIVDAVGFPEGFVDEKVYFNQSHAALRELSDFIKEGDNGVYTNDNFPPELVERGRQDPMEYVMDHWSGEQVGLIAKHYVRYPEGNPEGEVTGLIVANYDSQKKEVDEGEKELIRLVGSLVGDKVQTLLEAKEQRRLIQRLEGAREEILRLNRELLEQVKRDSLTGLYNKKIFHRELEDYLGEVKNSGNFYYLLLVDLDHFKSINDQYGHSAGDRVLTQVGEFLKMYQRSWGAIGYRVGGEEFGLIMEGNLQELEMITESIRAEISKSVEVPRGRECLTLSMGVCKGTKDFVSGEEWYRKADAALYIAKQNRNKVVFSE